MQAGDEDYPSDVLLYEQFDVGVFGDAPGRLRAQQGRVSAGRQRGLNVLCEDREDRIRQLRHDEADSAAGMLPQLLRAFVSEKVERREDGLPSGGRDRFLPVENARNRCGRYPRLPSQIRKPDAIRHAHPRGNSAPRPETSRRRADVDVTTSMRRFDVTTSMRRRRSAHKFTATCGAVAYPCEIRRLTEAAVRCRQLSKEASCRRSPSSVVSRRRRLPARRA